MNHVYITDAKYDGEMGGALLLSYHQDPVKAR